MGYVIIYMKREHPHFDNKEDIHKNLENHKENNFILNLDFLIIPY